MRLCAWRRMRKWREAYASLVESLYSFNRMVSVLAMREEEKQVQDALFRINRDLGEIIKDARQLLDDADTDDNSVFVQGLNNIINCPECPSCCRESAQALKEKVKQ